MTARDRVNRLLAVIQAPTVWVLRLLIGATFIFAGFTKVIDPWGFVFKIEDYLAVWGIDWLWREVVMCVAMSLSVVEFCVGVLVLTGCLRRSICWALLVIMAFMLPLTLYIYVTDPVPDCGCFGDALVISNRATFYKNVLITLGTVYLLYNNAHVRGIFAPFFQWLVIFSSVFYCLVIGFFGFSVQPLIDFREYRVGTDLVTDEGVDLRLVYERGGERREFGVDELPDSTWTYVGRVSPDAEAVASFSVFDGDDVVTHEAIDTEGEEVLLIVPDIKRHNRARANMANNINDYVTSRGGRMVGIVAADNAGAEEWRRLTKPEFPIYTADDTTLKELVRGAAGLVYLVDGKIVWKRNIYSLPGDYPDFESADNELASIRVVEDGYLLRLFTGIYVASLLIFFLLGFIHIKKEKKQTTN